MRFTDEPAPPLRIASKCDTLQIFSVKVGGIIGGLQWPLNVFGMVALRDPVDHNRNIIFTRGQLPNPHWKGLYSTLSLAWITIHCFLLCCLNQHSYFSATFLLFLAAMSCLCS
jgi:hypothetical protein